MSHLTKLIPRRSTFAITLVVLALLCRSGTSSNRLFESNFFTYCFSLLLIINWRSFPGVWHLQLIVLTLKLRLRLYLQGPESLQVYSIAQNPFDRIVSKKNEFVSLDVSDYNLHLSNTSYGVKLDGARFKWFLEMFGIAADEGLLPPLALTTFIFLKEIPLMGEFEIDINIISWDEKWMYYLARFTTSPPFNSPKDTPRIINCLALQKSCFKLGRLTIPPSRVLSFSGLGADRANYLRTLELRKKGMGKAWLKFASGSKRLGEIEGNGNGNGVTIEKEEEKNWGRDGMEIYEERRLKRLDAVEGFRDISLWKDL